jgi:hypothetical protein
MIISHKYKYVFVQLPRTACTAIARELIQNYDGSKILNKHTAYEKFLRTANIEEKEYFVFSTIRNPLDRTYSYFLKLKSDHRGRYTKLAQKQNKNFRDRYLLKRFNYIQKNNLNFATYFMKFHRLPYDDWSCLSHNRFNFIMRFEKLQEDFITVLKLIGIEPIRPLPAHNITEGKRKDFISYYNTDEVIERAKKVFGPFMKKWGYEFPSEWGYSKVSWLSQIQLHCVNMIRKMLWIYF